MSSLVFYRRTHRRPRVPVVKKIFLINTSADNLQVNRKAEVSVKSFTKQGKGKIAMIMASITWKLHVLLHRSGCFSPKMHV